MSMERAVLRSVFYPVRPVIELGRPRTLMCRHLLRDAVSLDEVKRVAF